MRKSVKYLAGIGLAVFIAGSASAQSLKSLRAQEAENTALAAEAEYTSEVCGVSVSASINWSRATKWPADQSLAEACDGALSAVEAACRKGSKPVRKFTCGGDGKGPSLNGTSLYYGASPGGDAYNETVAVLP